MFKKTKLSGGGHVAQGNQGDLDLHASSIPVAPSHSVRQAYFRSLASVLSMLKFPAFACKPSLEQCSSMHFGCRGVASAKTLDIHGPR